MIILRINGVAYKVIRTLNFWVATSGDNDKIYSSPTRLGLIKKLKGH